jgi:hypothetical protein
MSASVYAEELCECPFCWKRVSVSYEDGKPDGLIHELPICEQFKEQEPDEFMTSIREAYERITEPKAKA